MHIAKTWHCGYITYEADIDPTRVIICHCTDCQVLSSSAFRMVVLAKKGGFRLLTGQPTVYLKIADSGRKRAHAFCPRWGHSCSPRRRARIPSSTTVSGLAPFASAPSGNPRASYGVARLSAGSKKSLRFRKARVQA